LAAIFYTASRISRSEVGDGRAASIGLLAKRIELLKQLVDGGIADPSSLALASSLRFQLEPPLPALDRDRVHLMLARQARDARALLDVRAQD